MANTDDLDSNFGLLIAYVLPGFTALYGLPFLSSTEGWGIAGVEANATVAQFLSGTVEATAVGLMVSSVRWLFIDMLHQRTGINPPQWNFAHLETGVDAFEFLVAIHYRYYKYYANMLVALIWSYAAGGYALGWRGLAYWALGLVFFLASRDALRKYYERTGQLLRAQSHKQV